MTRPPAQHSDVIVVGAGISGLATAWYLARRGKRVQLLEKDSRPGGKIATHTQQGYTTETSASMMMNFRSEVDQFLIDSNIVDSKVLRTSNVGQNRFLIKDGELYPISMQMKGVFASPFLSWKSRLRLLSEWAVPKSNQLDESVEHFVTRRLGKQLLELAIEPYVAGTLACDAKLASADAVLPRLKMLERQYGSITAGIIVNKLKNIRTAANPEVFSFTGGMQTLVDKLADERSFSLHLNCEVKQLEKDDSGWRVHITRENQGQLLHTRQVVMAAPASIAKKLLASIDSQLSELLASISYAPMNIVHLGYDVSDILGDLNGIGFLVPEKEKSRMLGNLWMSSAFRNRAPRGKVLLSSYLGGSRLPQVGAWSDEACVNEVTSSLSRYLNIKATPEMVKIDRHEAALPLYHHDYTSKTQAIRCLLNKHRGLYINANYLGGVSIRDRILQANITAGDMLKQSTQAKGIPVVHSVRAGAVNA